MQRVQVLGLEQAKQLLGQPCTQRPEVEFKLYPYGQLKHCELLDCEQVKQLELGRHCTHCELERKALLKQDRHNDVFV